MIEEQMGSYSNHEQKQVQGITTTPEVIRKIPGANAGIENILKTARRKF
jgi:hypothetical protein